MDTTACARDSPHVASQGPKDLLLVMEVA